MCADHLQLQMTVDWLFPPKYGHLPHTFPAPRFRTLGHFALSSASHHLTEADSATVLLNGENLEVFESKIVKKTSGESFSVLTPVEFEHLGWRLGIDR